MSMTAHTRRPMLFVGLLLAMTASAVIARDCIEVIPADGGASFWNVVAQGARSAARELGIDVVYPGAGSGGLAFSQAQLLQQLVDTRKCKALVLAPDVPNAPQLVDALADHGIVTVYIDRNPGAGKAATVVATDNYQAGQLAGEQMVKLLKGNNRKRVLVARLRKGIMSTDAREQGFIDAAGKGGLGIISSPYLGTDVEHATTLLIPLLREGPSGIFAPNESSTEAVLAALGKSGKAGKLPVIGFDLNRDLYHALADGRISRLMVQRPFKIGYLGVSMAWRKLHGGNIPRKFIDSGLIELTRENMHEPKILYFTAYPDLGQ